MLKSVEIFLRVESDGIEVAVAGVGNPLPVLEDVEQAEGQIVESQVGMTGDEADDGHGPVEANHAGQKFIGLLADDFRLTDTLCQGLDFFKNDPRHSKKNKGSHHQHHME